MATTELFRMVLATYGYKRTDGSNQINGIYDTKEQALRIKEHAVGIVIPNDIGLGWPRAWRVAEAIDDDHGDGRGAIIAGCEPVEEQ